MAAFAVFFGQETPLELQLGLCDDPQHNCNDFCYRWRTEHVATDRNFISKLIRQRPKDMRNYVEIGTKSTGGQCVQYCLAVACDDQTTCCTVVDSGLQGPSVL